MLDLIKCERVFVEPLDFGRSIGIGLVPAGESPTVQHTYQISRDQAQKMVDYLATYGVISTRLATDCATIKDMADALTKIVYGHNGIPGK